MLFLKNLGKESDILSGSFLYGKFNPSLSPFNRTVERLYLKANIEAFQERGKRDVCCKQKRQFKDTA